MDETTFQSKVHELLPMCAADTIRIWIVFASECLDREQYVHYREEPDKAQALAKWLDNLYAGICRVEKDFGEQCATQLCNMSRITCLYPGEMHLAAEYLKRGGTAEGIAQMVEASTFDVDDLFVPDDPIKNSEAEVDCRREPSGNAPLLKL